MKRKQRKIVFFGPSGSGKTTITKELVRKNEDSLFFSVSHITRPLRDTEKEGVDYFSISVEKFMKNIEQGKYAEWQEVYPGRFYGTPLSELEKATEEGKCTIFDVDVEGALNLKKKFGADAFLVFIDPGSVETAEKRLKKRQAETLDEQRIRIEKYEKEVAQAIENKELIDYWLDNGDDREQEESYNEIETVVEMEIYSKSSR